MEARETVGGERPVENEEVERLRQTVEEERERTLRLLAEFENFRRRTVREQESAAREGRRAALLPLLTVLDTLERALAAGSTDRDFYEGVAATHRLFTEALRQAGAEAVESVVPADGGPPGTVAQEVRRGWRLGSDLLRPAQVLVASSPEADDSWR
jgi:molecular chaperone GrpE